jgi:hypothetical protein
MAGTVPLCERFDTIGPLAHSVEDCALLLAAIQRRSGHRTLQGPTSPARGWPCWRRWRWTICATARARGSRMPSRGWAGPGRRLTRITPGSGRGDGAGRGPLHRRSLWHLARGDRGRAAEDVPPHPGTVPLGRAVTAVDYVAAWRRLEAIRRLWADRTAVFDAVLVPTSPILPPDANRLMTDDAYYVTENLLALRNTRIGNLMGVCALTLPTSQPSCGIHGRRTGLGRCLRDAAESEHVPRREQGHLCQERHADLQAAGRRDPEIQAGRRHLEAGRSGFRLRRGPGRDALLPQVRPPHRRGGHPALCGGFPVQDAAEGRCPQGCDPAADGFPGWLVRRGLCDLGLDPHEQGHRRHVAERGRRAC